MSASVVATAEPATYTRSEAARLAGVSVSTLDEMIARHLFPVIKTGGDDRRGRVLIPRRAFDRFLAGELAAPQ